MPCLSGKYDPDVGVLIQVGVVSAGSLKVAPGQQQLNITQAQALLDTGASGTCISPSVAQAVGLQPVGKRNMSSATHTVPMNLFLVDFLVPFGNHAHAVRSMQVMEFAIDSGSPYQILLGRDIICRGSLSMSFDGHYTFSL